MRVVVKIAVTAGLLNIMRNAVPIPDRGGSGHDHSPTEKVRPRLFMPDL